MNPVLEAMIEAVLLERPEDPGSFMLRQAAYLRENAAQVASAVGSARYPIGGGQEDALFRCFKMESILKSIENLSFWARSFGLGPKI